MDLQRLIWSFLIRLEKFSVRIPILRGSVNILTKSNLYLTGKFRASIRHFAPRFGPTRSNHRVVIINHFFDQDLESITEANQDCEILVIHYSLIRRFAEVLFPDRCARDWNNYYLHEYSDLRRDYRNIMDDVVKILIEEFRPNVVVSPSDLFFWIREFIPSVQSRDIPFVVIDKEGTVSPHFFNLFAKRIADENPFISDYVLVWSERQREFWKLGGVPEEQILLVGQQRSDYWFREEKWLSKDEMGLGLRPEAKLVLFFSFAPHAYIPIDIYDRGEVRWDSLFDESHEALLKLASKHPEIDFVIKTHPQQINLSTVTSLVEDSGLKNVVVASGAKLANPLNVHADVVCGFLTTCLIEAMILKDRPIIYTFWGDAKEKWSTEIIPFHESGALSVAESPNEFTQLLEQAIKSPSTLITPDQLDERKEFINTFFWNADGNVGNRTVETLKWIASKGRPRDYAGPWKK